MNPARLIFEWAILLALAVTGAVFSQASDLTGRIDNQLLDFGASFARPALDKDIALVTIDDQSLAEIGGWPWRRDVHARLVDQLEREGARVIVLDVLFLEPSDPEADAALAEAMERSTVLLPFAFAPRRNAVSGLDPIFPIKPLHLANASVGHVEAEPDSDGVLRRFDLTFEEDGVTYAHLAVQTLSVLGENTDRWLERRKPVIIPFRSEAEFAHQPAARVLDGSTIPGFFKDKIVLIGATAPGLGDQFSVPVGSVQIMSGVGAQANLLAALRADAIITPVDPMTQGLVAIVLIFGLFMAFWYFPPRYVLICAAGLALSVLIASLALLAGGRLWFEPGSIVAVVILAYPLWSWRRLSHVSRYLDREAERLAANDPIPAAGEGFDYVTAQVEKLRGLIRTVRGSLAFLQQVIEAAPDAIVVLDAKGRVEMLNERASALFPDWAAQPKPSFPELLVSSRARQEKEGTELVSASGQTYLIARAPIEAEEASDFGGEIIALRDVSDLRRLDDERQQMLEFLSHDMRTPQVAIVGLTDQAKGSGATRDMVSRIRLQAERTLKLADDFVQLARLNNLNLSRVDSDIGALIEEACDRAYAPARAKTMRLEQVLPQEPCFAQVDPSLIARMLDNLIGNAIKYSGENTNVLVSLEQKTAGGFTLIVADEGPGLSKERLSSPFARFGAYSTHAGPSSGLGLAFVKKVVDLHAGTIDLRSDPGEGTRFEIAIPDSAPEANGIAVPEET